MRATISSFSRCSASMSSPRTNTLSGASRRRALHELGIGDGHLEQRDRRQPLAHLALDGLQAALALELLGGLDAQVGAQRIAFEADGGEHLAHVGHLAHHVLPPAPRIRPTARTRCPGGASTLTTNSPRSSTGTNSVPMTPSVERLPKNTITASATTVHGRRMLASRARGGTAGRCGRRSGPTPRACGPSGCACAPRAARTARSATTASGRA